MTETHSWHGRTAVLEQPPPPTGDHSIRDVARLLGVTAGQVRSFVRAGVVSPSRGSRGELRFGFQDLVVLRSAKALLSSAVSARRVRRALVQLSRRASPGPLSGLSLATQGEQLVAKDRAGSWEAESGQGLLDIPTAADTQISERLTADDWYQRGCDLEDSDRTEARQAYLRALQLSPGHAPAHVNLGRLHQESGDFHAAETHYRRAIEARPKDGTAAFNLGTVLEDQGRLGASVEAYTAAIAVDPSLVDAHYNLALVYERTGNPGAALRHLRTYQLSVRSK